MKKFCVFILVLAFVMFTVVISGTAYISNPNPAKFANDDGTELWTPFEGTLNIKYFDYPGTAGPFSFFGFYFSSIPGELIPVFWFDDQLTAGEQLAIVDFKEGKVFDVDANVEEFWSFSNKPDSIGFFYGYDQDLDPSTDNLQLIYSQSILNSPLVDSVSTFPSLNLPDTYLITFDVGGKIVSAEVVGGITAVPEPTTLLLIFLGLLGLTFYRRKRYKG